MHIKVTALYTFVIFCLSSYYFFLSFYHVSMFTSQLSHIGSTSSNMHDKNGTQSHPLQLFRYNWATKPTSKFSVIYMMIAYNRDKIYKLAWLINVESLICIYGKTMETDLPCFLSCVHELSYVSGEQVNGDINVLLKCYDLKKVLLSHSVVNRRAGSFFLCWY